MDRAASGEQDDPADREKLMTADPATDRRDRMKQGVALALAAIVLMSIPASVLLTRANEGWLGPGVLALPPFGLYAMVGTFIVVRRPKNALGWIFLTIGVLWVTGGLASEYSQYSLVTRSGSMPAGVVALWYSEWYWIPALYFTFVYSLLLFPSGHVPNRRWRRFLWLAVVSCAISTVVASLEGQLELASGDLSVRNPIGVLPIADVEEELAGFPILLLFICSLGALASIVVRFRSAGGLERQQLKWVAYAAVVLVVGFAAAAVLDEVIGRRFPLLDSALFSVVPIASGIAILRYRLYDIDRIINRTLVYGLLSAALAAAYLSIVVVAQSIVAGSGEPSPLIVAASTLAVATLFRPLRARIQKLIDRRFNRQRYDAARTIEAFSSRLRDEIDLDTLNAHLLGVVQETMEPARVSLWLRP